MLMPAALLGIGAFRRKARHGMEYKDLGFTDYTTTRLIIDNNTSAKLLDCAEDSLGT